MSDRANMADWLIGRPLRRGGGDRIALVCDGQPVTYADLAAQAARAAGALQALDVRPEQRVAIALPDSFALVAGYVGALMLGAVPVLLNPGLSPAEFVAVLRDSGAGVAVVTAAAADALVPLRARLPAPGHVLTSEPAATGSFDKALAAATPLTDFHPVSPDDAAYMLYTSGTTGQPKGTVHLHRHIEAATIYAEHVLGFSSRDRVLSTAPLWWAYALGNALHVPLLYGAAAILQRRPLTPNETGAAVAGNGATLLFTTPAHAAGMLETGGEIAGQLARVRHAVTSGEPLPASVYSAWRERIGGELLDAYGTTELMYTAIANWPGASRPGASGQLLPGHEALLLNETGQEVLPGLPGSLWLRSPSRCSRYWRREQESQSSLYGPWLFTGDVFVQDSDGFFYYQCRTDDLFKVGGLWASPRQLETALRLHPAVAQAAVVAEATDIGPDVTAYVVPSADVIPDDALADALLAYLREQVPAYQLPQRLLFCSKLAVTHTGKIQRFKLQRHRSHRPPPGLLESRA